MGSAAGASDATAGAPGLDGRTPVEDAESGALFLDVEPPAPSEEAVVVATPFLEAPFVPSIVVDLTVVVVLVRRIGIGIGIE